MMKIGRFISLIVFSPGFDRDGSVGPARHGTGRRSGPRLGRR